MSKILQFSTISLGSEVDSPDPSALARWVGSRRGLGGDLTTYKLEQSLDPQIQAGIDRPCAGGLFYRDRWMECLAGITGEHITGELDADPSLITPDIETFLPRKTDLWFALPAPHLLGLRDGYYGDEEEAYLALIGQVKRLIRYMRDQRAGGHVIIGKRGDPDELAALAMKRCFFFLPDPARDDLATLLEYQRTIAVFPRDLPVVISLMDEYRVQGVVLVHPDTAAVHDALMHFEPENISIGGYCTSGCTDYWKDIAGTAVYPIDSATETK